MRAALASTSVSLVLVMLLIAPIVHAGSPSRAAPWAQTRVLKAVNADRMHRLRLLNLMTAAPAPPRGFGRWMATIRAAANAVEHAAGTEVPVSNAPPFGVLGRMPGGTLAVLLSTSGRLGVAVLQDGAKTPLTPIKMVSPGSLDYVRLRRDFD